MAELGVDEWADGLLRTFTPGSVVRGPLSGAALRARVWGIRVPPYFFLIMPWPFRSYEDVLIDYFQ